MFKKLTVLIVTLAFFTGCAGMSQLNPANLEGNHARGNFVNNLYLNAYADYQRYAALPNLTDEAKQLLKVKREIIYNMGEPTYGAVVLLNSQIQTGIPITDAAWNAMLDKLLNLETGWYTEGSQYTVPNPQVFKLDPQTVLAKSPQEQRTEENLNRILHRTTIEAQLAKDTPGVQAIWEGILLELIRAGVHAVRALIAQRGLDPVQMEAAYNDSYAKFKALDVNQLIVIK